MVTPDLDICNRAKATEGTQGSCSGVKQGNKFNLPLIDKHKTLMLHKQVSLKHLQK